MTEQGERRPTGRPSAIYGLCDPITGRIRYVGKANDPVTRLAGHLRETRRRTPVYDWIAALRRAGRTPVLQIIEWCCFRDWEARERFWIAELAPVTRLLNLAEGGDQPQCSAEVRAVNGRRNARAVHDDPRRRRIWELKRSLGQALRQGYVSEATKAKMRLVAMKRPDLFGDWAAI